MKYHDRINYICDGCGKESGTVWGRYQKKQTNCCWMCAAHAALKGKKKPSITGDKHYLWGGGIYKSTAGYNMVKTDEVLPSGKVVYKREHILKMEEHLGRKLNTGQAGKGKSKEQVHHVDGDKTNNKISNLVLCSNMSEHRSMHHQLQSIALELVRKNVVLFDHEKKQYYINPEFEKKYDCDQGE